MAQCKKMVVAGNLVIEAIYPMANPSDNDVVRRGKRNLSSAAQRRMNREYCWQKLELMLAANFGRGDIFAALTYDDEHLPLSRRDATRQIQSFWRKLRKHRAGGALKYIYVTEHKHGDGRWHHHIVLNSLNEDYDDLNRLWGQGHIHIKPIVLSRDENWESLARYLCKEQRDGVGDRQWSCSRGLSKPERETRRVTNDVEITPPKGAVVLADSGLVQTVYGQFRTIKYMLGGWGDAPKRHRSKRRRRN